MKYIYILLIILLIIIISYIIINNNYKEYFYNLQDDFKLINIDSSLHNTDCSGNNCDIKYIDIKYHHNNKSIYYLTQDNNIYILQATGGLSKNKLVYFEDYDITSVAFSEDYNYGFIAIKNKVDKMVKIFYSTDSIKSWNELKFNYNQNINQVRSNYREIHNIDSININVMRPEDIIINNLLIIYETKDGKNIPKSLIFTTKGYTKFEEEKDKYLHSTELTIREIILNNLSNSFDDILKDLDNKDYVFDCIIHKLYFDNNYDFYILKNKSIEKIFNHNNRNIILLIKNYTELELDKDNAYELICLNENNKEIYFNFNEDLLNNYIIDLKYYENTFESARRNFLIGVLRNKKEIIAIDLERLDNADNNNYLNSISLEAKKLITSNKYNNPYLFEIDYKKIEIYSNESTDTIKDFDIDYNYTEINGEEAFYYELYIVTLNNKFNKQIFNTNYEKIETVKNIEYPSSEITFINNVLIHKKKSSNDKSSVIINNNDKLFIYRDSIWNRIDNFNVEFSNYNIQDFMNKMDNPNKLIFKGENYLENKIYEFSYEKDKYVDILLVGGGGGGGYGGGGGGGGAIRYIKNMRLSKGTYIVTVGSGGEGGYLENDSNGKNGFLTSFEKKNDDNFIKIIAAGGGGGGGFNSDPPRTPTYGTIGYKDYTSGGGGGAGKEDGIGGLGNNVSGNGGSSYKEENYLYGGGGGGGSSIRLQKYHDSNGYNANNTNIGYGGKGINLEGDIKFDDDNNIISVGGNGGYYGYVDTGNERQIFNKFKNHINKNINIFGKGGDGTILFINETYLSRELTVRNRGNSGLVIILESTAPLINDEIEKEKESKDSFLNMFSIKDRNLQKEYDDKIQEYQLYLEDELNKKEEKRREMIEEKLENEKNISKIEVRDYTIMEHPRSYDKPNENPIKDSFLPYLSNVYDGEKIDENDPINSEIEYYIIKTYKDLLYRQPTKRELYDYKSKLVDKLITKNDMRQLIVNTEEYKKVTNLQTNSLNRNQLYSIEKANMSYKIKKIYNEELNEDMPNYLINPLNDIFTKLYLNEYLLRAIFINEKFPRFKDDLKNNNDINPNNITEVFLKYYDMNALKDKANDIMKYFKYNKYDNKEEIKENETDKYSQYSEIFNEEDINYQEELERLTLTNDYDLLYKPVDEKYDFDKEYDSYVDERNSYTEYLNTL